MQIRPQAQPGHDFSCLVWFCVLPQHFKALAEGKKATSPSSNPPSQAGETDLLSLT